MGDVELYGAASCPYTAELREQLQWRRVAFTEYDVEHDTDARTRLAVLTGDGCAVPVLVHDGVVREVGWHGRTCLVRTE